MDKDKFDPEKFGFTESGGGWERDNREFVKHYIVKKYESGRETTKESKGQKEGCLYYLKHNCDLLFLEENLYTGDGCLIRTLYEGQIDTNEFAEMLFRNTGVIE